MKNAVLVGLGLAALLYFASTTKSAASQNEDVGPTPPKPPEPEKGGGKGPSPSPPPIRPEEIKPDTTLKKLTNSGIIDGALAKQIEFDGNRAKYDLIRVETLPDDFMVGPATETCLARDVIADCEAQKFTFTKPTTYEGKKTTPCIPNDSSKPLVCYVNDANNQLLIVAEGSQEAGWTPVTRTGLVYMTNINEQGYF